MPVNPGRLRHRVEVLDGTRVNTVGGPQTTWDSLGTFWAAVVQVGADGAARYAQAPPRAYSCSTRIVSPGLAAGSNWYGRKTTWRSTSLASSAAAFSKRRLPM